MLKGFKKRFTAVLEMDCHEQQLGYEINSEGMLIYRKRIYVSNQKNLKKLVLDEYHKIPYV